MSRRHVSVFDDPDVAAELAELHQKICCRPADKASNNIVFVCKTHYINCLIEELGMSTTTGNPIYNLTVMSNEDIQISPRKKTLVSRFAAEHPLREKIFFAEKNKNHFFRGEFCPRNVAEKLHKISRRHSVRLIVETLRNRDG